MLTSAALEAIRSRLESQQSRPILEAIQMLMNMAKESGTARAIRSDLLSMFQSTDLLSRLVDLFLTSSSDLVRSSIARYLGFLFSTVEYIRDEFAQSPLFLQVLAHIVESPRPILSEMLRLGSRMINFEITAEILCTQSVSSYSSFIHAILDICWRSQSRDIKDVEILEIILSLLWDACLHTIVRVTIRNLRRNIEDQLTEGSYVRMIFSFLDPHWTIAIRSRAAGCIQNWLNDPLNKILADFIDRMGYHEPVYLDTTHKLYTPSPIRSANSPWRNRACTVAEAKRTLEEIDMDRSLDRNEFWEQYQFAFTRAIFDLCLHSVDFHPCASSNDLRSFRKAAFPAWGCLLSFSWMNPIGAMAILRCPSIEGCTFLRTIRDLAFQDPSVDASIAAIAIETLGNIMEVYPNKGMEWLHQGDFILKYAVDNKKSSLNSVLLYCSKLQLAEFSRSESTEDVELEISRMCLSHHYRLERLLSNSSEIFTRACRLGLLAMISRHHPKFSKNIQHRVFSLDTRVELPRVPVLAHFFSRHAQSLTYLCWSSSSVDNPRADKRDESDDQETMLSARKSSLSDSSENQRLVLLSGSDDATIRVREISIDGSRCSVIHNPEIFYFGSQISSISSVIPLDRGDECNRFSTNRNDPSSMICVTGRSRSLCVISTRSSFSEKDTVDVENAGSVLDESSSFSASMFIRSVYSQPFSPVFRPYVPSDTAEFTPMNHEFSNSSHGYEESTIQESGFFQSRFDAAIQKNGNSSCISSTCSAIVDDIVCVGFSDGRVQVFSVSRCHRNCNEGLLCSAHILDSSILCLTSLPGRYSFPLESDCGPRGRCVCAFVAVGLSSPSPHLFSDDISSPLDHTCENRFEFFGLFVDDIESPNENRFESSSHVHPQYRVVSFGSLNLHARSGILHLCSSSNFLVACSTSEIFLWRRDPLYSRLDSFSSLHSGSWIHRSCAFCVHPDVAKRDPISEHSSSSIFSRGEIGDICMTPDESCLLFSFGISDAVFTLDIRGLHPSEIPVSKFEDSIACPIRYISDVQHCSPITSIRCAPHPINYGLNSSTPSILIASGDSSGWISIWVFSSSSLDREKTRDPENSLDSSCRRPLETSLSPSDVEGSSSSSTFSLVWNQIPYTSPPFHTPLSLFHPFSSPSSQNQLGPESDSIADLSVEQSFPELHFTELD